MLPVAQDLLIVVAGRVASQDLFRRPCVSSCDRAYPHTLLILHLLDLRPVISGGLDLSPVNDSDPHINPAIFPNPPQAADGQPGDRLAHVDPALNALGYPGGQRQAPPAQTPMLSPTSFFKTPSYFWNQAVPSAISAGLGTGLGAIDPAALQNQQQGGFGQQSLDGSSQQDAWASPGDFLDGLGSTAGSGGGFDSGSGSAGGAIGSHQDGPVVRRLYTRRTSRLS
jgi:hypothetical protein